MNKGLFIERLHVIDYCPLQQLPQIPYRKSTRCGTHRWDTVYASTL